VVELEAANAALESENAALGALVEVLEARIATLERETSRHSGNSGKPPSSDTLADKGRQAEERLSRAERRQRARAKAKQLLKGDDAPTRRPGKQPGEAGKHLEMSDAPDAVVRHEPELCCGCGADLRDAPVLATEARQVFDLPRRRLDVTEHRAETRRCGCGRATKASFPPEARAPASYGPGVRALAVYLMARHHLPVARAGELLAEVGPHFMRS